MNWVIGIGAGVVLVVGALWLGFRPFLQNNRSITWMPKPFGRWDTGTGVGGGPEGDGGHSDE
jgi:hypothetical protein